MTVAIVIPVYREPNSREWVSLRQCCKILSAYPMFLVCPKGMDTTVFHATWQSYGLTLGEERFEPAYFQGLEGYNRLCLSKVFYQRFAQWDYILFYQPDCYVFSDQLMEWCSKGYDFVGAPLVGKTIETTYYPTMRLRVGNGGFSLRRVQSYIDFFDGRVPVFSLWHILTTPRLWKRTHLRFFARMLPYALRRSKPIEVAQGWVENEDDFWSGLLDISVYPLKKPSPQEAMLFSFERFAKELYSITGKLPFGCHGWHRWGNYEQFWHRFFNRV